MRKIRDDLGVQAFEPFTDLVNYFTVPQYELKIQVEGASSLVVAKGASATNSTVGDIAGIMIKDVMLTAPRADMAVPELERMTRLTDRFIQDLKVAVSNDLLIIFFDAVEKMSIETNNWVWDELLTAVRDGNLHNTKFVFCGRTRPELGRDWREAVEEANLQPLARTDIIDYLEKRGVDEPSRGDLSDMLLVTTAGNVLQIANYVDAFLEIQKKRLPKGE
jgi:hypothetical protein